MRKKLLGALAPAALTLVWAVGVSAFAQSPQPQQPQQAQPSEPQQPQQPLSEQPRQQAQPARPQAPRPTRPLPPDVTDHDSMDGAGSPRTYPNMPVSPPRR